MRQSVKMALQRVRPCARFRGKVPEVASGQCNNCGSTNVHVQAQNRFLRKAQTYATCQDCGKTTPLSGLLGK